MNKIPSILLASAVLLLGAGCFSKPAPTPTSPAAVQPNPVRAAATASVTSTAPPPLAVDQPMVSTSTTPPPPAVDRPMIATSTPPTSAIDVGTK